MKKILCVILSVIMVFPFAIAAFAAPTTEKVLKFNDDGKFKILQFNDTQDIDRCNKRLVEFIEAAVDSEKPDLVVFVGDQLSDNFPGATPERCAKAIDNVLEPLEKRHIPFLMTLGNHDHDRETALDENGQYEVYAKYDMCYAAVDGQDHFTYNVPVMTNDGSKIAFNIYMMDTNNHHETGGYAGINAEALKWYNDTSAALKAKNGGEPVPSLLYQHIPCKEIYNLLKESKFTDKDAVYAQRDGKWYTVDTSKAQGKMGEAPCSENFDVITGQYQAWLENGDIMGAWFAHDHVDNFTGVTDDGIRMGYNGGSGFRSYGATSGRTCRVFELDENNVENYTTRSVTYTDVTGKEVGFLINDLMTPALLTILMRVVYFFFGGIIALLES